MCGILGKQMGKHEGKRALGRPRCRWEDTIKIHVKGMVGRAYTGLIWLRIGTHSGFL